MTREEAIAEANEVLAKIQRDGPDSVSDSLIHERLANLRSSRTAAAAPSSRKKAPAKDVNLDDIFGPSAAAS